MPVGANGVPPMILFEKMSIKQGSTNNKER